MATMPDDLPRIAPGQTWVSQDLSVTRRFIVGRFCEKGFSSEINWFVRYRLGRSTRAWSIREEVFVAWARRSGARPRVEETG